MNQLDTEDAAWVRAKIAERGMTQEVEAEARQRIANPNRAQELAVRAAVWCILFIIMGAILHWFGAPLWTYVVIALFCVAISK
jgi:hypothetical protein